MNKLTALIVIGVLLVPTLQGQDVPRVEIGGVYSFVPQLGDACHGGGVSLAVNANHWFGGAVDFDGCRSSSTSGFFGTGPTQRITNVQYTYLFGPRFAVRSERKLTPFAQILFGGAYSRTDSFTIPDSKVFAMSIGGGTDFQLSRSIAVRAQPEYLQTRFAGWGHNHFRLRAGLVFRLGIR